MREALVFGASGQIGTPLLARLQDAGWRVIAVSRDAHVEAHGAHWLRGDLAHVDGLPASVEAIFSCGPLDQFAQWYAGSTITASRVIAFGSTSIEVKSGSSDVAERDIASRLAEGEQALFAAAIAHSARATLLRPTLVYGAGRDRTLTRVVALAARSGWFVLPRNACGLRQPVHVDDLAAAALLACDATAAHGQIYALPGGETLTYRDMIMRTLDVLQPRPRLVEVPPWLFGTALEVARLSGYATGLGEAAIARMRSDLVFDATPAQRDFGYAPRLFHPDAKMFSPR
ncbi:MAG: NAD-dependent epimerase/dehydratase family protein [Luteimonas sp.]